MKGTGSIIQGEVGGEPELTKRMCNIPE